MSTKAIQKGEVLTLLAPSGGVTSGGVYVIDGLVVVAITTAVEGASFAADACGVHSLTKVGSQAWDQGERIYWDAGNSRCTKTPASGLFFMGHAVEAVGSGAGLTTGKVRLQQTDTIAVQAAVADLAGVSDMTGTVDGAIADIAAVSTSGGNTYSDAAINTAITAINLQLKEIATKLNALAGAVRNTGVIAP